MRCFWIFNLWKKITFALPEKLQSPVHARGIDWILIGLSASETNVELVRFDLL